MRSVAANRALAVIESLAVHAVFAVILVFGLSASDLRVVNPAPQVIQATVVNVEQLQAARERETERLREEAAERRREEQRQREAQEQAAREERERQEAQRREQERREQTQAEADRQRREALDRERRLAEEQQKQLEELRRQREQAEAERRQRERELAELEEQRRLQEQEKAQRLEEERRQQLLDLESQQLAQAEQATLEQQWIATIQAVVTQNWRRPPSAPSGARCLVRVDQLPGGDVVNASIMPGCEVDEITRRSIVDAVMRSEPLPYKGFEEVFRRQLTFQFIVPSE